MGGTKKSVGQTSNTPNRSPVRGVGYNLGATDADRGGASLGPNWAMARPAFLQNIF